MSECKDVMKGARFESMEHFIELDAVVTGFHVTEQCIDCMCGKNMIKVDKYSGDIICQKEVFEKEGLSRKLVADEKQIFIYDFCTLYILNQKDYELIGKWQLGDDLRSDICGIAADDNTVYCSIRNGKIITLDRRLHQIKEHMISESSMWSVMLYDSYLVCGTVDGKVLLLNKATLGIEKELALGKKNVGSLFLDGNTLYAASHDGKLFKIWNKDTLEEIKRIHTPLKLSGRTQIENDSMYISSRNILGIDRLDLRED